MTHDSAPAADESQSHEESWVDTTHQTHHTHHHDNGHSHHSHDEDEGIDYAPHVGQFTSPPRSYGTVIPSQRRASQDDVVENARPDVTRLLILGLVVFLGLCILFFSLGGTFIDHSKSSQ